MATEVSAVDSIVCAAIAMASAAERIASLEDLKKANLGDENLPRPETRSGTVRAVRTVEGNFAKLRIDRFRGRSDFDFEEVGSVPPDLAALWARTLNIPEYHLQVEWVTYRQ
jgi:hypothetical protein